MRLHPISVRELKDTLSPDEALNLLNRLGGFPEPFLSGSETEAARWRNQYYTDLVREDILEFGRLQEIRFVQNLRREQQKDSIAVVDAGKWLAQLSA